MCCATGTPPAHLSALSLTWPPLHCFAHAASGSGQRSCRIIVPRQASPDTVWKGHLTAWIHHSSHHSLKGTSVATNTSDGKFHCCSSRRFTTPLVKETHPLTDASGTLLLHTMMLQSQMRKYRMTLKDFDLVESFHDILSHKADPKDLNSLEPRLMRSIVQTRLLWFNT